MRLPHTEEPGYNEHLYNKVLGITNDLLHPSNSNIYVNEPRYNETLLSVADQDLQIRGPGHPDPEIKGVGGLKKKNIFRPFGPQYGLTM